MSAVHKCVEGTTIPVIEVILDEYDQPVNPAKNTAGPRVRVYDTDKSVIAELTATVDPQEPGAWRADIPVPKMGLTDTVDLRCVWRMRSSDGETYKSTHILQVSPQSEERTGDIIAIVPRDLYLTVVLPFAFDKGKPKVPANTAKGLPAIPGELGDMLSFSLYRNNVGLFENLPWNDGSIQMECYSNKTVVRLPNAAGLAKLEPLMLIVEHTKRDAFTATQYMFKTWVITPQILVAAASLEQYINKARLSNVIPELEYTQADLIEYLARGLNLFNSFPPQITAFTGTNMQGPILDGWLQCSAYYALAAQLQAEGALAFDFSGQSVSLNVDRTPSIESALGRVESALNDHVKPAKKLLARYGVISGDGSQGGKFMDGSSQIGALSLINAATTRVPGPRNGSSWARGLV
ncbi:hypothetical protein D3C85_475790 [compost metagenome]